GPPRATGKPRLSVDRAFSVKGAGTVVTGTLVEGRVRVGDPLFVVGESGPRASSARGLHVHDRAVDEAEAPCRLAVNLAQLSLDDVKRGDVVTGDPGVSATRALDVALRLAADSRPGRTASLYIGTARSTARVDVIAAPEESAPDAPVLARLR